MIGTQELIIILVIVLILFGASRLPGLARGLGEAIREFRKATSEGSSKEGQEASRPSEEKPEGS